MVGIEDLNKNQDQSIDLNELQDAMKPSGFLNNEKNVRDLKIQIDNPENPETIIKLKESLQNSFNLAIDDIVKKETFSDNEIQILNLWNILLGNDRLDKKKEVVTKMNNVVNSISARVNVDIGKNSKGNGNYYTVNDIKAIQLQANICFGEDIIINGSRGDLKDMFYLSTNTANERKTNIYIYRQELITRQGVIDIRPKDFEKILNIPNLGDMLGILGDIQTQNKVFGDFLKFFLGDIRVSGMFFENKIGGDDLIQVLNYKILAEKYRGMSGQEYIKKIDTIQGIGSLDLIKKELSKYPDMGKFYDELANNKTNQITLINKGNVDQNNYNAIKSRIDKLANLRDDQKDAKVVIYKELLELADKTNNSDLKNQMLISLSTVFTEDEIKQKFGDQVVIKLQTTRKEISKQVGEYEAINDMLAQIESPGIGWNLSAISWEEFIATWPLEANALRRGRHGPIHDYSRGTGWTFENRHSKVPEVYQKLSVPGCDPIYIRMTDDFQQQDKIKEVLSEAKIGKITLLLPEYKKEYVRVDQSNQGDSYSEQRMDLSEKDKNILDLNDLAYSKKDTAGNINLYKIGSDKPYQTITVEQQQKAKQINQLAVVSTFTPESVKFYSDVSNIQAKMSGVQTSYDKMGKAKIDWKNIDVLGVLFSVTSPIGLPMINSFVPVIDGLSPDEETEIFTQALQVKDKIGELKKQESSLVKVRNQLLEMQKNIDKSKLVSADENKLKQSLNAVNFLIDGIQSGGAITQFAEEMSNAKNVSANGTFTELGLQRLKNNGLQMICAIGAAVAVMAAPFSGGLSLLAVAALSTAAGMAGARLGQRANEGLQNRAFKKTVLIDGIEREVKYDDPTDVEMLKNYITGEKGAKTTPKDFLMNVGMEFVVGTISVYGFMKAGQILGKGISNFAANNPNAKLTLLLKKIKPQFGEITDPYTQNMFDNVAQGIKNKSFGQKFISEFSQELGEEGTEGVAGQIEKSTGISGLSMLMTTWNSLTPGANTKIYANNRVSFGNVERVGNNAELELHYDGNVNELISHFQKTGFTLNTDGTLSKKNQVLPTITDVIKLSPSKIPVEVRNMGSLLQQYGMNINYASENEVISSDPIKLAAFKIAVESQAIGVIKTEADGTIKFITGIETVIIKPSTNVDVNHTTTELQNMINEKTNEIEKLQSKKDKTPADEVALGKLIEEQSILKDELSQKNNSDVGDEVSAIDNTSINKLLEEYNKETDKTKKAGIKDMIEVEFKEYSKKFKEYMEKSVKEIALLEKEGKYEEALQKKNKIYQSQEFMFGDKLPKIIGKLSDIDGIQSFLKETNFREISDRLSSIQELIKTGNRELAQDLIKDYNEKIIKNKRIDAKLKDKLNLGELTIENIQEYQKNFENNPAIKQYYEIMKEMANADYEAIRIEKTVYVNETVAEYTARYEKSKKTMNDFKDSKLTEEIRDRISDDIVSVTMKSGEIGDLNRSSIKQVLDKTLQLCEQLNVKSDVAYRLCTMLSEHYVFQTVESSKRQLGDHGERHLTGNIKLIENMMKSFDSKGKIDPEYQFMTIIGMSMHDIGYAIKISAAPNQYAGTNIHPFTSANFFESYYGPIFMEMGKGEMIAKISNMIKNHDGTYFDLSSPEAKWLSICKLADNFALFSTEKFPPFLVENPKYIEDLYEIARLTQFTEKNKIPGEKIQALKDKIDADTNIKSPELKKNYKEFIDEMTPRTFKTLFGMMEASLDFDNIKSETLLDGKTITKVIVQRNNSVIGDVYNNTGDQIGKPFEDYLKGGNILTSIEGKPITKKSEIRLAIEAGGIIIMDRAGNKLIYEVQNINYNMVGDINLLDKTTVELSDLLQKKQAETNQIKDNLDKLKNGTKEEYVGQKKDLEKKLLESQTHILIIETQIHSNKIVEDARLRQEAVATKDMARNIKKYEDLKSDLKKQESKLSEATTDDERTEINNNIKELKEDISTIRDQQSNIFQNTFSEQYINELSKIDPTLKQLWLEIINISNDFEIKMDKISELQAKISDISVEQIQNAKQVASAIKPKNQKTGNEIDMSNNEISESGINEILVEENASEIIEEKNLTEEIQTNRNNPEKINLIISNLADKVKNTSNRLMNVIQSNQPMIQKTKIFVQSINKLLVIDHLMHEIKAIKTNYKDIVESINQKERYRLAGASTDLLVNLGMATAVTGKHIVDVIHGHMVSGLNINHSFNFALENIKNISGYIKLSFTVMEGQKSAYNKIQELGKIDMEKIYQNKDAYLSEYNTETKKLSANLDKLHHMDMFGKFILDQKYDMPINDQTEVGDMFVHIINKMKGNISSEEFSLHIKNINELASMINPDKTLSRNVYAMAKNVITGKVGNFNYNFDAVVEDQIGVKYREGLFN